MKVIDEGHFYEVQEYDTPDSMAPQQIRFMKRQGEIYPGNKSHYSGTNCQELIRVLIDRLRYVNNQIPDMYTLGAIGLLQGAIFELEERAARRHHYTFPFDYTSKEVDKIEELPTCLTCGHIICTKPNHRNGGLK